jgi:hypothetical protein
MSAGLNQEQVNDAAKLIMHRLVARSLARDPSLLDRAKVSLAAMARRFPNRTFVREWEELLRRPAGEIRILLTKQDRNMTRLRGSSPFGTTEGLDFTDPVLRQRIWCAAKRIVARASGRVANGNVRSMVDAG